MPTLTDALVLGSIGLLPASVATGIGSETQQPLARVVVGGMITSAGLISLVLPAMYRLVYQHAAPRATAHPTLVSQDERSPTRD